MTVIYDVAIEKKFFFMLWFLHQDVWISKFFDTGSIIALEISTAHNLGAISEHSIKTNVSFFLRLALD